jgi:hypothetical protein
MKKYKENSHKIKTEKKKEKQHLKIKPRNKTWKNIRHAKYNMF